MPHIEHSQPPEPADDTTLEPFHQHGRTIEMKDAVPDEQWTEIEMECSVCKRKRMVKVEVNGMKFFSDATGKNLNMVCPRCEGKLGPSTSEWLNEQAQKNKPDKVRTWADKVSTWVPAIYYDSDVDRFPQSVWLTHSSWVPGPKGKLFYGPPRTCKSRMCYHMAIEYAKLGKEIRCYDPRSFRAMIERNIANQSLWDWYDSDGMVPFFLLDDLGKFKGEGKRIEEELFNLVKLRHENRLGMLITSNLSPAKLAGTLSPNIAEPLVERLREMCSPVPVVQTLTEETELPHVDPHSADL